MEHKVVKNATNWTGHLNGCDEVFFSFDRQTWYEPNGKPSGTDVQALFRKLAFQLEQEAPND